VKKPTFVISIMHRDWNICTFRLHSSKKGIDIDSNLRVLPDSREVVDVLLLLALRHNTEIPEMQTAVDKILDKLNLKQTVEEADKKPADIKDEDVFTFPDLGDLPMPF